VYAYVLTVAFQQGGFGGWDSSGRLGGGSLLGAALAALHVGLAFPTCEWGRVQLGLYGMVVTVHIFGR
jgi:hypothetical protein